MADKLESSSQCVKTSRVLGEAEDGAGRAWDQKGVVDPLRSELGLKG